MPRKKPTKYMKFGDMHFGQWFKRGDRVFIKMQNILPSGIKIIYRSFEIASIPEGDDARHAVPGSSCSSLHFNAIDQDGIPGSCPDHVEFEVIDSPVKQTYKHEGDSILAGCRICQVKNS
jgi:hypothetical protein